eukprot:5201716-Karenia_brevis.AAC.1
MYAGLRRRFRVAGGVTKEFVSSNGILQGCPISVIFLNALMSVWSQAVEKEVVSSSAESYADDTQALVNSRSAVTKVATLTDEFANHSGQTLNAAKSFAFTTVAGRRRSVSLTSGKVRWKSSSRIVGAEVTFQGQPSTGKAEELVEQARDAAMK